MAIPPLIRLSGVSKSYRRERLEVPVLHSIDLLIPRGGFLALMGPSGSGKTTLLNLLAGIDRPSAGELEVCGHRLNELDDDDLAEWRGRNVGYIFQNYNLLPVLNAFENVELPLLLGGLPRAERRALVERALARVNLADRLSSYPRQLSGGQEQRVAIARAIVHRPQLIVADEPTGALDRGSAEEVLNLLRKLNHDLGMTIVMVTHDPRAADHARTIIHLEKGLLNRTEADREQATIHPGLLSRR